AAAAAPAAGESAAASSGGVSAQALSRCTDELGEDVEVTTSGILLEMGRRCFNDAGDRGKSKDVLSHALLGDTEELTVPVLLGLLLLASKDPPQSLLTAKQKPKGERGAQLIARCAAGGRKAIGPASFGASHPGCLAEGYAGPQG
ncbi:unnamed protein product, partial [Chrysoparadoxa australica]